MKKKRRLSLLVTLAALALCYAALTVLLAFVNFPMFVVSLIITVGIAALCFINGSDIRKKIKTLFASNTPGLNSAQRSVLMSVRMPVLVTDSGNNVLWYNQYFRDQFLKADIMLESIGNTIDGFDPIKASERDFVGVLQEERHYEVYVSSSQNAGETLYVSFFYEDTQLFETSEEFRKTRPSVIAVTIDNYDEVMQGARESDKSTILSAADRLMDDFINGTNGVMRKISAVTYFGVIEEQHMASIIAGRFKILDDFRKIDTGGLHMTISVGVGRGARTMYENQLCASQALDMAIGRGGDQAAVKTGNEYTFYGGISREVERRTRIKARTIAAALLGMIKESSNVVIVGHEMADIDAIGSAAGLARAAFASDIPVKIAVNESTTLATPLIELLKANGYDRTFVSPTEAKALIKPETLLIVTDTQLESRVDGRELVGLANKLVVIDHHRKAVGHIDSAMLFYHDPYASSCSELVCELLQFMSVAGFTLTTHESLALLAGIMLDTKNFTVRTGVRTFEASAYLRKMGAEPAEAKALFSTSYDVYKSKAEIVTQSEVYRGCAISMCEHLPEELRLAVPQAADDMLNIDGINASIVAYMEENTVYISARSLGGYNVQLIMESMGGGGHQTMAGVQLRGWDLPRAHAEIIKAIDNYLATYEDPDTTEAK